MKCPHCGVAFHKQSTTVWLGRDVEWGWTIESSMCPDCKKYIFELAGGNPMYGTGGTFARLHPVAINYLARPLKLGTREKAPTEVPAKYAADYNEAGAVLGLSPKSAAALGRRTLQHILRDEAQTTKKDLNDQIEEVIASKVLPTHLADDLHAVRVIGNFAAHPIKSTSTGEIVEVEPGEAEWTLDTLLGLFDFYCVEPTKAAARKAALNAKLKAAGKPEIP